MGATRYRGLRRDGVAPCLITAGRPASILGLSDPAVRAVQRNRGRDLSLERVPHAFPSTERTWAYFPTTTKRAGHLLQGCAVSQAILDLIVSPDRARPQGGTLRCGDHAFRCILGRNGVSALKREGDGATPTGRFRLQRVLYRQDRLATPPTSLPTKVIAPDDGWCDDPADILYNRPVSLPYGASAETLWREDVLYDVVVIIGHNDDPVVPGAGSTIFLHVASPDGEPTAGCVALALTDILAVLRMVNPSSVIDIRPPPD